MMNSTFGLRAGCASAGRAATSAAVPSAPASAVRRVIVRDISLSHPELHADGKPTPEYVEQLGVSLARIAKEGAVCRGDRRILVEQVGRRDERLYLRSADLELVAQPGVEI